MVWLLCLGWCEESASAQTLSQAALVLKNSCRDAFGSRVVLEFVPNAENALLLNGSPVILLDANMLNHQPAAAAEFLYFSECAHHVLGHVLKAAGGSPPSATDGADADCWALRFLQRSSGYGVSETAVIMAALAALRVASYPYAQGVRRADALRLCR